MLTDLTLIIKEEVNLLVKSSLYPNKRREEFPDNWSAVGAEYRIRMALNQLEKKNNS